MRKIALLVLSLYSAGCVPVQLREAAPVGGIIRDAAGEPVFGADVHYAEFPSSSAQTGKDGSFALSEVKHLHWLPLGYDAMLPCPHLIVSASGFDEHRECVQVYDFGPRSIVLIKSGVHNDAQQGVQADVHEKP